MDNFWHEMMKVTGPVSATVRAALDRTKFVHGGLQYLDDPTIDAVEADIRRFPAMLQKSEDEVARMLAYPGDIKEFRFLTGERCVMKLIASKVQQYGFNCFYNPARTGVQKPVEQQPVVSQLEQTVIVEEVRNKIRDYYDRKCDGSKEHVDFCLKLANVGVEIQQDSNGDMARIICPFCDQLTAMMRRDKSGAWKISNFSAHIKFKHNLLNYPGKETGAADLDNSRKSRKRSHCDFSMDEFVTAHYDSTEQQLDSAIKIEVFEM
ncbi:uncharacterized protein LOC131683937 [Topomyia yanbarensis]|uniref:uncharacterized protein LOC131683937 n=1 Tax=Topomyia yanbarensis TaxID=2498891 RepID=UPI00273CE858|nr:uncharacterized protein LOC131683937 [Topomyia yanbarensis]